ncbi:hypothetical protein [Streptomyces geysiriensis]|uniref:hypothetical protein n=1 Tax=Streptomyces geysiriensis TaxID=68207 RepID=UPI001C7DCC73|nr:hypothetical protein [Streptomyces geysiriensis]MBX4177018.1 hypothetical protein [Streptomyces geysiriensis]
MSSKALSEIKPSDVLLPYDNPIVVRKVTTDEDGGVSVTWVEPSDSYREEKTVRYTGNEDFFRDGIPTAELEGHKAGLLRRGDDEFGIPTYEVLVLEGEHRGVHEVRSLQVFVDGIDEIEDLDPNTHTVTLNFYDGQPVTITPA